MHIEHVDMVGPLQRGKTDRRILQRRHQREFGSQTLAETLLVLGGAGPCRLLGFAVIVAGQLLDAGGEDRREYGRIRRQERPQRGFWQSLSHLTGPFPSLSPCGRGINSLRRHRATSQVVPSLESLMTTPIAAS